MGAIEKFWYAYVQTEEYQENMEHNYTISEDISKKLEELIGRSNYLKAEDMAFGLAVEAEKSGFIQGFRIAMELREDCKMKFA